MPLITDRDVLLREPSVFGNAIDVGTVLRNAGDGVVSGTTFTSASSNFVAIGVDFGHVATINDVACEIVSRNSATQLTISLPRSTTTDPLVEPTAGSAQRIKIITFKRLSDLAEAWMLNALGIDADDPYQPLTVSNIVNLDDAKHLVALRTIQQAFTLAAAITPTDASLKDGAAVYNVKLAEAKRHVQIHLQLDGESQPDIVRRLDAVTLIRE